MLVTVEAILGGRADQPIMLDERKRPMPASWGSSALHGWRLISAVRDGRHLGP